jgi:hypothetical protein
MSVCIFQLFFEFAFRKTGYYFAKKTDTMGPLGFNELLIVALVLALFIVIPVMVAYRLGKQKGRLMEMERQRQDQLLMKQ